jgi:penicillin-binding protein 2
MYKQRLYVFIALCVLSAAICITRLAQLQFFRCGDVRTQLEKEGIESTQLPTVRGDILDRNGRLLATDRPVFYLHINYKLLRLLDDRFWAGNIQKKMAGDGLSYEEAEAELRQQLQTDLNNLQGIIDSCKQMLDIDYYQIEEEIWRINNKMWNERKYICWYRKNPEGSYRDFKENEDSIALDDILAIDLAEMHQDHPVVELKTQEQVLQIQLKFSDIKNACILPRAKRIYPYENTACQTIGWVGPAQDFDKTLFDDKDSYSRYLFGEVSGREDGVEKACEVVLRGKRGEVVYNRDDELLYRRPTRFGADVTISIDIELQKQIEAMLSDPQVNPNFPAVGAVVLDVATGDILALVSMPIYDLNGVRRNYSELNTAPHTPMLNRALIKHYSPGSVVKPIMLIAGLQENKVSPSTVISCPSQKAPKGWPSCWLFKDSGSCHDWKWQSDGGNVAANAIKGSCNIYFSRLAGDKLQPAEIQKWLFKFGFGRKILPPPVFGEKLTALDRTIRRERNLRQSSGQISSSAQPKNITQAGDLPKITRPDSRMFGIGQGNLQVTVLQVANAMAAIARGGIYKSPRLFLGTTAVDAQPLGVSQRNMEVVFDGMWAVVNEVGGTAYKAFVGNDFSDGGITVYGKTGSTEGQENAWFAGFAKDDTGRAISIAIAVQKGQRGSRDAAPLARNILNLCRHAGHIGQNTH